MEKIAVSIDTCLIYLLTTAYKVVHKNASFKKVAPYPEDARQLNIAIKLLELRESGKIEFYVVPQVLKEFFQHQGLPSKDSENSNLSTSNEFLVRYCKYVTVSPEYEDEYAETVVKLFNDYVKGMKKGRMPIPEKDLLIIAQSSAFGLPVITQNGKDFVFCKSYGYKNEARRNVVRDVNRKNGVKGVTVDDQTFIPVPLNFTEYVNSMGKKVTFKKNSCEYDLKPIKSKFNIKGGKIGSKNFLNVKGITK
ncbi:MAG: hypothetical protein IJ008_00905 [Clostridia bacterium]|nr:hypothetical protein [Clostridia bacterium]